MSKTDKFFARAACAAMIAAPVVSVIAVTGHTGKARVEMRRQAAQHAVERNEQQLRQRELEKRNRELLIADQENRGLRESVARQADSLIELREHNRRLRRELDVQIASLASALPRASTHVHIPIFRGDRAAPASVGVQIVRPRPLRRVSVWVSDSRRGVSRGLHPPVRVAGRRRLVDRDGNREEDRNGVGPGRGETMKAATAADPTRMPAVAR